MDQAWHHENKNETVKSSIAWCALVAEHKRDELAENELIARGVDVHVPRQWQKERVFGGRLKTTYDLIYAPYFYVRFDLASDAEYALVTRQRGVSHVLESRPGRPGPIADSFVDAHRERERGERANLQPAKGKGRADLELHREYSILAGPFKDRVGKLFDFHNGSALLDIGMISVTIDDRDIQLVAKVKKAG